VTGEGPPRPDHLDRVSPPEHPHQRLAFSRERLAWLDGDELRVFELADFSVAATFRADDARNVVGLTGGGYLIAGREHLLRLSDRQSRPEVFPHAPRIGPTTIVPSRQESEQFWMYYEGIDKVPRFDLGAPSRIASLPMLDWTELYQFDRGALLGVGDGSFVYTTRDGLRRIDNEGHRENLPQPEVAGRVWALALDARLDRVWAATSQHLYLLEARGRADVVRRLELAPHPLALAAEAGVLAVLSLERASESSLRLRVDVYPPGADAPRVLRTYVRVPPAADAAAPPAFEPEVACSSSHDLVAVAAFGLEVFDYRRSVRLYPPEPAQKLAPGAQ
jgi:hypothetical protein